ncbi:sigma-54-dependent transcriptional regulator [Thermodesulfobacteriota bacterium]
MEQIPDSDTPILVVDDDEGLLLSIKAILVSSGMPEPALVSDSRRVMELARRHRFHLILLDQIMPHFSGREILKQIKTEFPDIECIIITAVDDVSSAVEAMRFGAYDYLVKPLNQEKLIIVINHALERYNLRHELTLFGRKQSFSDLKKPEAFKDMVVEDEAMARVFLQVEAIAPTDYSVVITGESGTGKEVLARVIHKLSNRAETDFVGVNMASFSKTIFEDEFFGHIKGAYTDAFNDKRGFVEAAQGGTLFLDEIAELDPPLQGKLLRVIEERELYRLGSTKMRTVDVRFIAATNRDLNEEIQKGNFRADLFYRLNMCHINIPPLRERRKDILALANHFLFIHAKRNQKKIDSLAPDFSACISDYSFPGNVRELENIIASAVLLERGEALSIDSVRHLPNIFKSSASQNSGLLTLAEMEKRHIQKALEETGGNRSQAAKLLGVNATTIYRKIEKYKLV